MKTSNEITGIVKKLQRLEADATPSPWIEATEKDGTPSIIKENGSGPDYVIATLSCHENKDFICPLRDHFPSIAQALLIAVEALEKLSDRSPHPNDWQPPSTDGWDNTGDVETAGYEQAEWHAALKARSALSQIRSLAS